MAVIKRLALRLMESRSSLRHRRLEERLGTFLKVRELSGLGLDRKRIALDLGMSVDEVGYWLRAERPSKEVYNPDLTPRADLAYLVGAYLGDGRTAGEQDKKVRFKVADLSFADQLNDLLARVIGREPKRVALERGYHSVNYDCAVLYDYLQQDLPKFEALIESFPQMFLRGFFDAEGYATQNINENDRVLRAIWVGAANCQSEYLGVVRHCLATLEIESSLRVTNRAGQPMNVRGKTYLRRRDVWHIEIRTLSSVKSFQARIDFALPRKRQKLRDLIEIMDIADPMERYDRFTELYERVGRNWTRKKILTSDSAGE